VDYWGALAFVGSFFFAVYDGVLSARRMRKYGEQVELNPWVTRFWKVFGTTGACIVTAVPTLALLILATAVDSRMGLGFILGYRGLLFRFQRISHRLEAELDALNTKTPNPPPSGS